MAGTGTLFTYRDYLLLPEEKRVELVGGDFYVTPAPSTDHQRVSRDLGVILWRHVRERGLGEVFYAPCDVILSETDVVQPDLLFVARARAGIIAPEGIRGAPDLVVEILSPATADRDRSVKPKLYWRHGVREYWIVDPASRSIEVYTTGREGLEHWRTFTAGMQLASPLLPDLAFAVDDVFPPAAG